MKKIFINVLLTLSLFIFIGCQTDEADIIKPVITLIPELVEINYLEPYDLMDGVTAFDNIDLDITDKVIIVDNDGFTNEIPGDYNVVYSVTDTSGNTTKRMRWIIVKEYKVLEGYTNSQVFLDEISSEKPKPTDGKCFLGAWTRKVSSSFDKWLGIEGIIKLPDFIPDENRKEILSNGQTRYLDNPSIYLGGDAGAISDIGLTWENGIVAGTNEISKKRFTFRPFWRYIHKGKNTWENAHRNDFHTYYFPGDIIRISIFTPKDNFLQLKIEMIEPTKEEKYVNMRKEYGVYYSKDFLSPLIPSVGHGVKDAEFRRVNAIDQVGNEGKPAQPTNAVITEAIWNEVYLYRKILGEVYKVPFIDSRYAGLICPSEEALTIEFDENTKAKGGEKIVIHPGGIDK